MTERLPSAVWKCVLSAMYNVELLSLGETIACSATGRDPQLKVSLVSPDGREVGLPRGIYNVVLLGTVDSGTMRRPCLYLDYGDGFKEAIGYRVPLGQIGKNRWGCRVSLPRDVHSLRLDPSDEIVALSNVEVVVEVISTARARLVVDTARAVYHSLPGSVRRALIHNRVPHWFFRRLTGHSDAMGPLGDLGYVGDEIAAADPTNYVEQGNQNWAGGLVADYTARMFTAKGGRSADYAAVASEPVPKVENSVKALAYYLPQMHPIPENDEWWGRGFTEWTNVSKAVAQFDGHYQPKIPGELGFYDLRLPDVMARQIELAKLYGLSGFCFYYYWFHGKRLLERPLDMFVEHKTPAFNFDFCLCWANENWTRRWDGADSEVLMGQEHSPEDHEAVFEDLARYFDEKRYICVDGCPVILIYRPSIIPDVEDMLKIWRRAAADRGMKGLYIVATNSFGFDDAKALGFDAICGFPPHGVEAPAVTQMFPLINSEYSGYVFRYADVVSSEKERLAKQLTAAKSAGKRSETKFPGVMVAWDNEARKPGRGNVFHGSTPELYREWLAAAVDYTSQANASDRQFVFVNAWNEWAEGAYLEPDRKFGYAYLAATASVIREARSEKTRLNDLAEAYNTIYDKSSDHAICAHLFYPDMIDEFANWFQRANERIPLDVIITVPDTWKVDDFERAIETIAPTRILPVPNRGRDVAPFLRALRVGLEMGYRSGCKVHSKKSPQRKDGDGWRQRLFSGLLNAEAIDQVKEGFLELDGLAIAAPRQEFMSTSDMFSIRDNLATAASVMARLGVDKYAMDEFIAGTMFWFKFEPLRPLADSNFDSDEFGTELGQIDGTLAHAFERVFVPFVKANGYDVLRYDIDVVRRNAHSDLEMETRQ
jgi:lipopolysaccharide biosynthesis protein